MKNSSLPTVGRLSANCRAFVGSLSANCQPFVGHLSVVCRPTVGRLSANCWQFVGQLSVVCRPTVGSLLAAYWPTVCRLSADRFIRKLFVNFSQLYQLPLWLNISIIAGKCIYILSQIVTFDYGMRDRNPIDEVRFYGKNNPNKPMIVRKEQVRNVCLTCRKWSAGKERNPVSVTLIKRSYL